MTLFELDESSMKLYCKKRRMDQKYTVLTDKRSLRSEIDMIIENYIREGLAYVTQGILFIEDIHLLDLECYTFLNQTMDGSFSPFFIFTSNVEKWMLYNLKYDFPFGISMDLVDR